MNYKELLISIYDEAVAEQNYSKKLTQDIINNINILSNKCFNQKGVFTVLVTLFVYKIINPKQDIRKHQKQIKGGFSGRTIDTHYITPTLKKLGLPSMAESGWLSRSLEQPYPYTLKYEGKIGNTEVKTAFLNLIDNIETKSLNPKYILVELFKKVIEIQKQNITTIEPIKNSDILTIDKIVILLDKQFSHDYHTSYGSKLPVIAFYSIYSILINELSRYSKCKLKKLESHTASDRTSKSAGDLEIYKDENLYEAIEIKLDKEIDANLLRIAREKIIKYNPTRYYILSYIGTKHEELQEINNIIDEVKQSHGCQIIINGVIPTLKYYLRLIKFLNNFFIAYSNLIQDDTELKSIHKEVFQNLVKEINDEI